jgi:hypothetical protein
MNRIWYQEASSAIKDAIKNYSAKLTREKQTDVTVCLIYTDVTSIEMLFICEKTENQSS